MPRHSVTVSDKTDEELRKKVRAGKFKTISQLISYALNKYLDDEATKRSYAIHGMALSLRGKTVEVDEKTLKKMKKALDIEDE